MEEIIKNIYTGSDEDVDKVLGKDDWSIVRACKFGPSGHKDILGYTTQAAPEGPHKYWVRKDNVFAINLLDLHDPFYVPKDAVLLALQFLKEELQKGKKVLIACNAGQSRGPTVTMLLLRSLGELPHPFMQSEKVFKMLYPKYQPGLGIRQFARDVWNEIGANYGK